jgi:glycyl-tRNA synthetase beta chain
MRMTPEGPVETYATPRRLTARVGGMAERQDDLDETITGPPVSAAFNAAGEPTPAAIGFARKQGVAFEALERLATPKGTYLAVRKHQRGRSAADALPEFLTGVLRDLAFPKQMHWDAVLDDGRGEFVFGRPIRWLLFLYGGRVVPYSIGRTALAAGSQVQDVTSGAVTYGHRFLATSGRAGRSIKVRTFDEYRARLSEHFVVLDHAERRDRIAREIESKARKLSGRVMLREHAALIDEVADLVEYPGVVAGFFDPSFLALPQEVLTTTLVHHQHYFPVHADGGALKEAFLAVVNTQPSDERGIARNAERVVTARLRDAKFFWDADRRVRLEDRLDRLGTIAFHKKLGSYRDKARRIERLADAIVTDIFGGSANEAASAAKAALIAKADLATDMVFEFTELQGTMGGIYARQEGEPEDVWKAIYYQYLPVGVEADAAPSRAQLGAAAVTWAAVSLADKIDSVLSLMSAGERATGSRDPFALRRQMQGVVKILMDLPELTGVTREVSIATLVSLAQQSAPPHDEAAQEVVGFAHDRIRYALEQRGFASGVIRSALAASPDNPLRARRVAEALSVLSGSEDMSALAVLFKRVKNIARELKARGALDRSALVEPAELALLQELDARHPRIEHAAASADYRQALTDIGALRPAVDRFFTEVFVMADDARLRTARLSLMAALRDLVLRIADISEIVPETS